MWLTNSSIGRKLVMSITGACLILFVTFHVLMNAVAIFWPAAYNAICGFLGANWYALIASAGLAALFIIHIIYAVWLTLMNRKARGNDRYKVVSKPPQVEWSSQNMLVLGIVILAFLLVHLIQFWAKMQLVEMAHLQAEVPPMAGTWFIQLAFQEWYTPVIYIIGFVALWFHMTHGFWSMFQSCGWNNDTWLPRLKAIGNWWATIVVGLFVIQAIVFTVKAHNDDYLNCPELRAQYAEMQYEWNAEMAGCTEAACTEAFDEQPDACGKCTEGHDCPEECIEVSEEF
jgi:succinate dehydrogenase cytochrome B subunit, b558 family